MILKWSCSCQTSRCPLRQLKDPFAFNLRFFPGVCSRGGISVATKQTCLCAREQVALETPNFPSDQGWRSGLLRSITEQLSSNLPLFLFLPWLLINQQDPLTVGCFTAKSIVALMSYLERVSLTSVIYALWYLCISTFLSHPIWHSLTVSACSYYEELHDS